MKEKIRLVRTLLEKRSIRRKEGRFVVEGPHLVEEAGEQIDFVVYAENLPIVAKLQGKGIECLKVSKKQFGEISEVETPQWILAVVKERAHQIGHVLKNPLPLVVFCIEVQDPGNLGTIIRTADAVHASGVVLSRGTVDVLNSKVVRSTMGSIFHLPIVTVEDYLEAIDYLKKKDVRIVAADVSAEKDYFSADYKGPVAILVGNEGAGLPDEVLEVCDDKVKIPMPGRAESLNVGVSTAVMLYEALRQRKYAR
ncbi:MAG: RNA methyltransferase [Candidatus Margulisiibacteriota bacterium]|nr:RNA methyltransferase [Candidatus Margulisiibacteriota bacterium]